MAELFPIRHVQRWGEAAVHNTHGGQSLLETELAHGSIALVDCTDKHTHFYNPYGPSRLMNDGSGSVPRDGVRKYVLTFHDTCCVQRARPSCRHVGQALGGHNRYP